MDPADGVFDAEEEYEDDGEDVDFKEAFGLPDQLPPVRLPSEAELAGMARDAPMIGQLRALAAWLGPGRAVTENAELTAGEAAEAAAALGLGVTDLPAVGRMRDVPRLDYLWRLALDAAFIELDEDETHAVPGEVAQACDDGDDDECWTSGRCCSRSSWARWTSSRRWTRAGRASLTSSGKGRRWR